MYQIPQSWCTVSEIQNETLNFWVILGHFLPFYPPNDPENQNFEKMKKMPGDVVLLHLCNINEDYMIYEFWNKRHDRIFCHFGPFFARWSPWHLKTKILKNWKKDLEISITHMLHKWQLNDVWFLRYGAWRTEFFVILDDYLAI